MWLPGKAFQAKGTVSAKALRKTRLDVFQEQPGGHYGGTWWGKGRVLKMHADLRVVLGEVGNCWGVNRGMTRSVLSCERITWADTQNKLLRSRVEAGD